MSKHRANRSARPLFSGQLAAVGVVAVALGAGSTSGLAPVADRSDAPAPVVTYSLTSATTAATAPVSGTTAAVTAAPASDLATDSLWYGLLSAAAVAGAVGTRQLVAPRRG